MFSLTSHEICPGSHVLVSAAHLMTNINAGMLHRAFSVFLFNSRNELLMHQRAAEKITFPLYWTNTCCSHPLHFETEMDTSNDYIGTKRAAVRKLEQELGIVGLTTDDFTFITRLQYLAPSDGVWGEHECVCVSLYFLSSSSCKSHHDSLFSPLYIVDHILVVQKDIPHQNNPNEINDSRYFTKEEMRAFIQDADKNGIKLSPWFGKIKDQILFNIWDNLGDLSKIQDKKTIHRFV